MKQFNLEDKWTLRAREAGFRARSAYKLIELDQRFHLLHKGMKVLDLAAAPGSFSQYASEQVGLKGKILALDIQPIKKIADNVTTKVCDITDSQAVEQALVAEGWKQVDLILSDVAPNISGITYVDQKRSVELNQAIVGIAQKYLKPRSSLVMKIFEGEGVPKFLKQLKAHFKSVKMVKVAASREGSREAYIVCK